MEQEADLLSVADAARRLERSTEQVRRYLREGRLAGRRFGGQWFIPVSAVEALLGASREQHGFLDRIRPGNVRDPLSHQIALGGGGGSNIAEGKDAYRRAFWWRRA
ncbi:MAG: helix-turn-helix domain-containing protein [Chloroflexota bacterium]|nr:helix-turn-helix domain-containing protein [Chloroflexota bacterium]